MGLIEDRFIKPRVEKKLKDSIAQLVREGKLQTSDPEMLKLAKADAFSGMPAPWNANPAGVPTGIQRYQFDYNHQGTQMRRKPQSNVSFQILREFSTTYEVARACINARKRQITSLDWEIVPLDQGDKLANRRFAETNSSKIELVSAFFDNIGGHGVRFRKFLDMVIEDILTLDAIALLRNKSKGGDLLSLTPLDAATIKLVVDSVGNIPEPPDPAYMQVIRGAVTAEMTTDDLIYDMMNPRSSTPYGLAPLESLIITVSSALRSNLVNLNYLTDGNVPEGLFAVPQDWNAQQIKEYQETWDAYLAGDPRATSRLRFVPGGQGVGYTPTKKVEDMKFQEFQHWLLLCTCAVFDITPQEIGFTLHQSTRANAAEQSNIQTRRGILPLTNFLREIFRDIIHDDLGFPDLDFSFKGIEDKDALTDAQAKQTEIFSGYKTVDEIRQDEGLDPLGIDEPFVVTGQPTFLKPAMEMDQQAAENPQAQGGSATGANVNTDNDNQPGDETSTGANAKSPANADPSTDNSATNNPATRDAGNSMNQKYTPIDLQNELRKFQTFAVKRKNEGKPYRPFESEIIPTDHLDGLNDVISHCIDESEVKKVLSDYRTEHRTREKAAAYDLKQTMERLAAG